MLAHQHFLNNQKLFPVSAGNSVDFMFLCISPIKRQYTMSIVPNSQLPNPKTRLLALVFSFGVALGSGFGYGFNQAMSNTEQQSPQTKLYDDATPIKYERLKVGMSTTDAQAILGTGGTELDRTATTVNVVWESKGYKIIATFENDKLKSKKQSKQS
jgi:hypothetical protein